MDIYTQSQPPILRNYSALLLLLVRQVWNAHAERKKNETGDSHITSLDRAELVPEATRLLREQGQADMAAILEGTTEGARKVIRV